MICSKCHQEKGNDFPFRKSRAIKGIANRPASGYHPWCKDCRNKATRSRSDSGAAFLCMLKDKSCMDCGHSFPPECMDFDHRPDTEKKFDIGSQTCRSLEVLLKEIAKCDVVCANCHRIRTQKRRKESCLSVL